MKLDHQIISIFLYIYIWLCLFLKCADFSKGRMFELCESYPRIIAQKITIMNVSFGIVWDCIGLTSFNGPDKLIDQCWPDPMIRGDGRGVLVAEIAFAERIWGSANFNSKGLCDAVGAWSARKLVESTWYCCVHSAVSLNNCRFSEAVF